MICKEISLEKKFYQIIIIITVVIILILLDNMKALFCLEQLHHCGGGSSVKLRGAKKKKKSIYIPNTPLFSKITIFHIFLVLHRILLHNLCAAITEHYKKCNTTL